MVFGGYRIGRNAANKVSESLIRRSDNGVNAAAVRRRWMLDLAETVPAALLMQLADVKELRVLAEQRHHLPSFEIHHGVSWMKARDDDI